MAIFDVTAPADATKAGLGAKVIREEIKAVFTTKFEGKVVEVISTLWECVKGWPRIYSQAAAPTPPVGAEAGREWWDSDDKIFYVHDGTAFERVGPPPIRYAIPLVFGVPQDFDTSAAWDAKDSLYRQAATGNFLAEGWHTNEGVRFNNALVSSVAEIRFGAVASSLGATKLEVRLYDETADVFVANTALTFASGNVEDQESADITSDLVSPAAEHRYRVQVKTTGGLCVLFGAELRVVRA